MSSFNEKALLFIIDFFLLMVDDMRKNIKVYKLKKKRSKNILFNKGFLQNKQISCEFLSWMIPFYLRNLNFFLTFGYFYQREKFDKLKVFTLYFYQKFKFQWYTNEVTFPASGSISNNVPNPCEFCLQLKPRLTFIIVKFEYLILLFEERNS